MVEEPPLSEEIRATLPPRVAASIAALEAAVQMLTEANAPLTARVVAMETRPSPKPVPGRRPGGQPGHRLVFRVPVPETQVAHTERHVPPACDRCGTALPASVAPGDPSGQRHQVVDLLPIQAQVTEHQVAVLTARYRLPGREAAACLVDRSRGGQVARLLLGEGWAGIVGPDRFAAYCWLGVERRPGGGHGTGPPGSADARSRAAGSVAGAVDVCGGGGGRADQQRGGAGAAARHQHLT